MSVISLEFFVFFLIVLIIYYILPAKLRWIWLFLSSVAFYVRSASSYQCVLFLVFLLLNYAATGFMSENQKRRQIVFKLILIFDILMLVSLKYSAFLITVVNSICKVFGTGINEATAADLNHLAETICPPRISYFALIVISYITDVYWGRVKRQNNFFKFTLFASYFPQMTSGPIVNYEQMEQGLFRNESKFDYTTIVQALMRVLYGLFKKLVVSERLNIIVNEIYNSYELYPGLYIPFAAACFALQLYTDFSGLMDIVLGISEALAITLPENFDRPFCSVSLAEFWRRWHITLGDFLKTYVFYAVQQTEAFRKFRKFCRKKLGKGYEKKYNFPQHLGLLISWFLIGLWHGGGFNYIFGVGIYMGLVIILSELCQPFFNKFTNIAGINTEAFSYILFKRARTFLLFIFGLSFFRAESLTDGFKMWKSAFSIFNPWIFANHSIFSLGLSGTELFILFCGLLVILVVSNLSGRESVRKLIRKQNFLFRLLLFLILFAVTITYGYYGSEYNAGDFIYGRF